MLLQAENLRSTALRKQAKEVLAAWRREMQQKQAARLAAQELHLKACRARAAAVLVALQQLVCLSAEADKGALAFNLRRQARMQRALCLQGEERQLLTILGLCADESPPYGDLGLDCCTVMPYHGVRAVMQVTSRLDC